MANPFTLFPLDTLSTTTLATCITEYKRMLLRLSRFSDGSQIQRIRAQVRQALAELVKEAEKRLPQAASKAQPAVVPVPRLGVVGSKKLR